MFITDVAETRQDADGDTVLIQLIDAEADVDSDMSFACKFHILFIVNNPDGCPNDADILTYL